MKKVIKNYTVLIERCPDTGFFVGHVPGLPGAHSQGVTLDELMENMREVIELVVEENIQPESEFIGIQNLAIQH